MSLPLLLAEVAGRRQAHKPALSLIDDNFPKQAEFLRDPARLKCGFCTRRAGKSYGAATLMFETALKHPGASILYIALTRDSAKKIMWKDCIKAVDKKYGLGSKFNGTELSATLPNGAILYLTGADADQDEMEKLLGQKYALVIIDEGASWTQDLRRLVYGVLKPAVADYRGSIVLLGTPGNITTGLFYDITTGVEPGWSLHEWTAHDNPYMAKQWAAEIKELLDANPKIADTPLFKQMYLKQWVVDDNLLVYKFGADRNVCEKLPDAKSEWYYVLGVDLGYDPDPSAFVLCAYNMHNPTLFVVETFKQKKMIVSDVAERIRHYRKRYPYMRVVIDAANKQAVEEMRQRYSLTIDAAEKHGKAGVIQVMNAEMIMGKIKLVKDAASELIAEWSKLVWVEGAKQLTEHPGCANHLSDAALYAWRFCYNYAWQAIQTKVHPNSEEAVDAFFEREARQIEQSKNDDSAWLFS